MVTRGYTYIQTGYQVIPINGSLVVEQRAIMVCLQTDAAFARHQFLNLYLCFTSPVRRLDQSQAGGGLGEHCSSPAVGRGVCAPPGRVAQPRLLATNRGNPAGAANRGRLLFGYFFFGEARKSD